MTEQLKAEAYVRSQRPALMQLSFGCEVKLTVGIAHLVELFCEKDGNFTATFVLEGAGIFKCSYRIDEVENLEIIGHRPQLQDWLAVLAEKNTRNVCVDLSQAEEGILYFEDEISHWSFKFNLTTGQPNSPEDYSAFNELISV